MSHHIQCCLAGVCCPPKARRKALAKMIEEAGSPEAAADAILSTVDLVPLGVGHMIREAYAPMFKAAGNAPAEPPNPEAKGTPDGKA